MNHLFRKSRYLAISLLAVSTGTWAQKPEPPAAEASTSTGTVSELGAERILIKTTTAADPLRYIYNKTTTYVDEKGEPVANTTIKKGSPVTVHFTKVGEALVASKIVIRKPARFPIDPLAPDQFTSIGTIADLGPDTISLTPADSSLPISYIYNKTTVFIDENETPLTKQSVRIGLSAMIYYRKSGDKLEASKIVVQQALLATDPSTEVKPAPTAIPASTEKK